MPSDPALAVDEKAPGSSASCHGTTSVVPLSSLFLVRAGLSAGTGRLPAPVSEARTPTRRQLPARDSARYIARWRCPPRLHRQSCPTSANCSGVETPKPTAIGNFVYARNRSTSDRASPASSCRAPVIPVREMAYTNPRECFAICRSRSSVLVGAARNTGASLCAFIARR